MPFSCDKAIPMQAATLVPDDDEKLSTFPVSMSSSFEETSDPGSLSGRLSSALPIGGTGSLCSWTNY